jgi:branched-chain amino acid transport system ATP-binding protein
MLSQTRSQPIERRHPIDAELLLSVRDLTVRFRGILAVDHLSFDVSERQIVSIIGPNGAGKTTALNAISGFVRSSGSVRFAGGELLGRPAYVRPRLGIGRTFQNLQLFAGLTLIDNVVIGAHTQLNGGVFTDAVRVRAVRRDRGARLSAMRLLRELGIEDFAERNVDGLPFGVQKLAGVARALAAQPRLLLLDEPAAGLNPTEVGSLGELIQGLCRERGVTVLLVEHNMRLVTGISDWIVVLDEGSKLTEGPPPAVIDDPSVIAAYLGSATPVEAAEIQHELA